MLLFSSLFLSSGCAATQPSLPPPPTAEPSTPAPAASSPLVDPLGSYPRRPLEKDEITLAVVQSDVTPITGPENAREAIAANLERVSGMIQEACAAEDKPDLLLLHEFPLTGYLPGSRTDKLQMTIQVPGPETEALGELARDCDAYLVFGAYVSDPEWPRHILSLNTVLDRQGAILKSVWKPRNIKRFYSSFEVTTSTVESLEQRFVGRHGQEDVFPVIQTEFGNLAVSTVQLDPFVFAAFAMKGAEIMLRTATLFFETDVTYTAMTHNVYSAMANIPHPSKYGGRSMVVNPNGKVMGQLDGQSEGVLSVRIPIAEHREQRRLPQYSLDLTRHLLDQYVEEIPPNHMDLPPEELPEDGEAMKALLDQESRWLQTDEVAPAE